MSVETRKELVFGTLRRIPLSKLPELLDVDYTASMPRRSKTLLRNLTKDVYSTKEPRLLVIIGHLYFDYVLRRMLEREPNPLTKRQSQSFHARLVFLNQRGKFDAETCECLREVNRLRNVFAHDIFYCIEKWDPTRIPYVPRFALRVPRRKDLLRAFNVIVLRATYFALFDALAEQHEWLSLEDVPGHYIGRSAQTV